MARQRKILVVDDERNTRLTLEEALEPLGYEVVLAGSGSEALERLLDPGIELVLLDLKMPGVDGLEVLRHAERERPDVKVLVLTAHGTVDSAVESMKHGAADLIQKPFSIEEIRAAVGEWIDPERVEEARARAYDKHVRLGREKIREREPGAAEGHLKRAVSLDPERPEALNLLGVVGELRHDPSEAQKYYRLALQVDATYGPARENLARTTERQGLGHGPSLGDEASRA